MGGGANPGHQHTILRVHPLDLQMKYVIYLYSRNFVYKGAIVTRKCLKSIYIFGIKKCWYLHLFIKKYFIFYLTETNHALDFIRNISLKLMSWNVLFLIKFKAIRLCFNNHEDVPMQMYIYIF